MSFTIGATAAKDGLGATIPGGLLSADIAGSGVGPTFFFHGLVDGVAGSNKARVTSAHDLGIDIGGNFGACEWETVAASQTGQSLGATGATGDYISGVLVVPATVNPGNVLIKDGSGSDITLFAGGSSSVSNLVPFFIPLGMISLAGAWKLTTGANVSCIGIGNFT